MFNMEKRYRNKIISDGQKVASVRQNSLLKLFLFLLCLFPYIFASKTDDDGDSCDINNIDGENGSTFQSGTMQSWTESGIF